MTRGFAPGRLARYSLFWRLAWPILLLCVVVAAVADGAPTPVAHKLCDLADPQINECSGLAASRRYPGLLWAHNDSGDTARLFLINQRGQTVTQVNLDGANNVDWEDIAIAGSGENAWLYVGDIGDNNENRKHINIYRIREPTFNPAHPPKTVTVPCEKMKLHYPDGPHNAETLIATPHGDLIIVTKTLGDSQAFKTARPFQNDLTQQLVEVGRYHFGHVGLTTRLTTGGDLSPDGKHLIVITYAEGYEWTLSAKDPWHTVWKTAPRVFTLPPMKQCEAVCYSADGKRLYLSSEKVSAPLFEMVRQ